MLSALQWPASPNLPATRRPLPELERELIGLAGHLASAHARFLTLLADFDRRGGWTAAGLRSCKEWLARRTGMSVRTATEQLRVAHALTGLPRIATAFVEGRISYSKVRAITRIATAANEQAFLELALTGTARDVERAVRAARRPNGKPTTNAALPSLSWTWAEDGSLLLRGRFTASEGAALVAEIEGRTRMRRGSTDLGRADGSSESGSEQAGDSDVSDHAARRAEVLLTLVTGTTSRGTARRVTSRATSDGNCPSRRSRRPRPSRRSDREQHRTSPGGARRPGGRTPRRRASGTGPSAQRAQHRSGSSSAAPAPPTSGSGSRHPVIRDRSPAAPTRTTAPFTEAEPDREDRNPTGTPTPQMPRARPPDGG